MIIPRLFSIETIFIEKKKLMFELAVNTKLMNEHNYNT